MNVSELFMLTEWISNEIIAKQIPQKYQSLQSILQSNTQPNIAKQPFDSQKNSLIDAVREISLKNLTKEQLDFLDKLGILSTTGEKGIEEIEDILYKNGLDLATAAQRFNQILNKINNGISKSNQIKAGLSGCVSNEAYELEDKILMRVSFTGKAIMENVKDFKDWGHDWYLIGLGVTSLSNAAPEDIKIIGARRGSIIIDMALAPLSAEILSRIILSSLKVVEKVLDIKRKSVEIQGIELDNDLKKSKNDAIDKLNELANNIREKEIETIINEVTSELKIKNEKNEGDKINNFRNAVQKIVKFIEKGGGVDFIAPKKDIGEESEGDLNNKKLQDMFQEIRQLANKISLIDHKIDPE